MRRGFIALSCLVSLLGLGRISLAQGRYLAVVVGISNYQSYNLLDFAGADGRHFDTVLAD